MIFAYHRIVADIALAEQEAIQGLVTSVETFRRHLQFIADRYDVVTIDEAAEVLRGGSAKRAVAVITFDDGYRDVYEQAFPVLLKFGLPATVFVVTGCVDAGLSLDHDRLYWFARESLARGLSLHVPLIKAGLSPDKVDLCCAQVDPLRLCDQLVYLPLKLRERALSQLEEFLGGAKEEPSGYSALDWEMIREMAGAGVTFGAHTDNHVVLTLEDEETIEREIQRSKQILEERLGRPVLHFAYPTGRYNPAARKALARAGFEVAVTTERRVNRRGDDLLTLGRVSLCEESTRGITGRYSESVARLRLTA
jgi:peptidoglycan/xylan/chitin deacetylase (PgdA/CDA1 family)